MRVRALGTPARGEAGKQDPRGRKKNLGLLVSPGRKGKPERRGQTVRGRQAEPRRTREREELQEIEGRERRQTKPPGQGAGVADERRGARPKASESASTSPATLIQAAPWAPATSAGASGRRTSGGGSRDMAGV